MSESSNPFALLFANIDATKPPEAPNRPQSELSILLERIFLITLDNSKQTKKKLNLKFNK